MLLRLEYKGAHPEAGYSYAHFCVRYRAFAKTTDLVMRHEHWAGEKCFVVFSGQRLPIYDARLGAVSSSAELFVAVLDASSCLYAEALSPQGLAPFVMAHIHAFCSSARRRR